MYVYTYFKVGAPQCVTHAARTALYSQPSPLRCRLRLRCRCRYAPASRCARCRLRACAQVYYLMTSNKRFEHERANASYGVLAYFLAELLVTAVSHLVSARLLFTTLQNGCFYSCALSCFMKFFEVHVGQLSGRAARHRRQSPGERFAPVHYAVA
jgi:hypothetical protein